MNITIGFIGVIISVITTGIMLDNSIQGRLDITRSEMREDMNILRSELRGEMGDFKSEMRNEIRALRSSFRNEFDIIRSDIRDLQNCMLSIEGRMSSIEGRTSGIEGKLALLIDAWDIAQPSPPAIAKQ